MEINKTMIIILKALKESLTDNSINHEQVTHEKLGLSSEQWGRTIEMLQDENLIKGYKEIEFNGSEFPHYRSINPAITLKGLTCLKENTKIAKILDFIKKIKETTPGL